MKEMKEAFLPSLNEFSELLRDTHIRLAQYIKKMGEIQKNFKEEYLQNQQTILKLTDHKTHTEEFKKLNELTLEFERASKTFRTVFQNHIDDTNFMLGQFSSHWGGYVEKLGVDILLNFLRKEYNVHTFIQRFQRFWHKTKNVEVDLLALSDTHAYIIEVKSRLDEWSFKKMLVTMDKLREQVPEYSHLKLQPVFFCINADEDVLRTCTIGGLWIWRYKGFDRDKPKNSFEWIMGE